MRAYGLGGGRRAIRIIVSMLIPLAILLVSYLVQTPRYALADDYIQDLFVSGRFLGEGSALMPYTLAPVSIPLSLLYALFPGAPWYAILLSILIVVSFAVAYCALFSLRLPRVTWSFSLIFLLFCNVLVTWYLTYTIVAFVATAAGLMLVIPRAAFGEPVGPRASDVAAVLLVAIGFSLRPESGMATFIVFSPFVVWMLVKNRSASAILRAVVMVATIAACYGIGQMAYLLTPGWEGYPAYLDAGRRVLDYPEATYEELAVVAPELSENDVAMMYDWNFSDTDIFNTELFERMAPAVRAYDVSNLGLGNLSQTYLAFAGIVVVCAIAVVYACSRAFDASGRALLAAVAAMGVVDFLVVLLRDRPRLHVVIPMIAVSFFALLIAARAQREPRGVHARRPHHSSRPQHPALGNAAIIVFAIGCLAVAGAFNLRYVVPMQRQRTMSLEENISSYLAEHPNELCIFLGTQGGLMGSDAFSYASWEYPSNALFVAGWEARTAPWGDFMREWELEEGDLLQQLPQRGNMSAVMLESDVDTMLQYLREHVDEGVQVELVEDLGSGVITSTHTCVYRFSIG